MSYGTEAAEEVVKLSLEGIEVAAKISGKAAERIAVLLYAVLKDQKRSKGKTRLTNMIKSGKELRVFAIRDQDLEKFSREARKYGVLYCVLKDNKADDGLTDIMVKAEDAGKINRIFQRFNLYSVEMGKIQKEVMDEKAEKKEEEKPVEKKEASEPEKTEMPVEKDEEKEVPERVSSERERIDRFLSSVVAEEPPQELKNDNENPTMARTATSLPSGRSSAARGTGSTTREGNDIRTADKDRDKSERPSVKKELDEIRNELRNAPAAENEKTPEKVPEKKDKPKEVG